MGIRIIWSREKNCWVQGDTVIPNWTPDEVKLTNYVSLPRNWYDSFINKKQEKTMDEEQEKTIVKNLKSRLAVLLSCKKNRVSQIATIGHDLKILINEIEEIENALHAFKGNDDEDC